MSYPVRRVLSRVAMISLGAVLARYIPSARLRRVVRVALLPRLASLLAGSRSVGVLSLVVEGLTPVRSQH
ncbi:MAG: hypothetical protein ACXVRU_04595 [Gaiellaceae bacterium]